MSTTKLETDGRTRPATKDDIQEGVILRSVDSNGYSYPFSDMVVTGIYKEDDGSITFDAARPFAFAHFGGEVHSVERIGCISTVETRYHVVLMASGKPATHKVG